MSSFSVRQSHFTQSVFMSPYLTVGREGRDEGNEVREGLYMYIEHVGVRINVLKEEETKQGRGSIPVSGGSHSTQVSEDKSSCHTNRFCQRRLHFILEPKKTFLAPSSPLSPHTHTLLPQERAIVSVLLE